MSKKKKRIIYQKSRILKRVDRQNAFLVDENSSNVNGAAHVDMSLKCIQPSAKLFIAQGYEKLGARMNVVYVFARVTGPQVCALRQQKKNSQAETVQVCLKSPFEIAIQQKWEQREKKGRKRREIGNLQLVLFFINPALPFFKE